MVLRHALLGLLARRPASGYDLRKLFERSLSFVWHATPSQLYAELNSLADAGLISAGPAGPRGRKQYAITPAGHAELIRWLTQTDPGRGVRNEALLRVFFLWVLPPADARAYLEKEAARARAYLDTLRRLEASIDWDDTSFDAYGRIVLENGLRLAAAQADWAGWATEQAPQSAEEDFPERIAAAPPPPLSPDVQEQEDAGEAPLPVMDDGSPGQ
ncbi:MAG: PadR family transcriptional regulator [Nocardiopsaceae bacterium]|nr:PadR family transcriptional regulator [Nocardiopsaceae bacterium]